MDEALISACQHLLLSIHRFGCMNLISNSVAG